MPRPREFAVLAPTREDRPLKRNTVNLADLKKFPGSWSVRGLDRITAATLMLSSETEQDRHFTVTVKYMRRSIMGKDLETPGKFSIWQRRGGYSIVVDCPKVIVDTATSLLSLAIYEDLSGFKIKNLNKENFLLIKKHAFSLGGVIAALHLRNIKVGDSEMSVYNMTGKNIGDPEKLIRVAKKVKRMGFRFPRLGESEFHFWVADWGGGTLYQPLELLPHQTLTLGKFFEEALNR